MQVSAGLQASPQAVWLGCVSACAHAPPSFGVPRTCQWQTYGSSVLEVVKWQILPQILLPMVL